MIRGIVRMATIVTIATVLLSVGCAEQPTAFRDATEHGGLSLELSLERTVVPVGDSGTITMRLRNETFKAVRLSFGSSCQILPYIETEAGAVLYPGGGGWMCLDVVTSLEVPAFGVVTRTFVVRGVARAEGLSDASLSPGDYRAYALLGEGPRELLLRSPAVRFQVR